MLSRLKQNLETRAVAYVVLLPLVFCVVAFLGVACYFALRESAFSPAQAALVTAAAGIVLMALILLVTKLATQRKAPPARVQGSDPGEMLEQFLREHADPVLTGWVRNNPDKAAIASLLLGISAGYSDTVRQVLMDMYGRYVEAESRRRAHDRDPG
ncbi:MAG: hypothetical protein RQ741_00895 [Wenzhouxiangellaceae bacterium]|nr:hypothetical protein [Wenzhouxiangellaceae bacterium]